MTHQQQALLLYKAMGWSDIHPEGRWAFHQENGERPCWKELPPIDYNFLSVVREKLLVTDELQRSYVRFLSAETGILKVDLWGELSAYAFHNASPAEQLHAIVKAMGLWKEGE